MFLQIGGAVGVSASARTKDFLIRMQNQHKIGCSFKTACVDFGALQVCGNGCGVANEPVDPRFEDNKMKGTVNQRPH